MLFCCSLLTALCCPLISLLSLLSSLCLSSHFSLLLVGVILRDSPHDCDNHTRLSAAKQSHCSLLPSLFPYSHFSPISSVADAHLLDRTAHQSLRALLQAIDFASTSIHGALCLTSTLSAPSRPWILCICIKMLLPIDFHFSVAEVFRVLDPTCYTARNISPLLGGARIKRTPIQQAESSPESASAFLIGESSRKSLAKIPTKLGGARRVLALTYRNRMVSAATPEFA